jgi:hybrid cluster-associated redox disulfide protein
MITKDMIIADIITKHPETLTVFKNYQLDCYECQIADLETLEHGAGVHKVSIDELLAALNGSLKAASKL